MTLGVLVLASMVAQVGRAESLAVQLVRRHGYTEKDAKALWYSCLMWWSYRTPLAFLGAAAVLYAARALVGDQSTINFAHAATLLMALTSAVRMITLRRQVAEEQVET